MRFNSGRFIMEVRDIMTLNPHFCVITNKARTAAVVMAQDGVGAVTVVLRDGGRLVGIITDRDLCLSIIAAGADPSAIKLRQCMSRNPVSCGASDDTQTVSEPMKQHQVRRVPVVDSECGVVGIVATADVAREENRSVTGEVLAQISQDFNGIGSRLAHMETPNEPSSA